MASKERDIRYLNGLTVSDILTLNTVLDSPLHAFLGPELDVLFYV